MDLEFSPEDIAFRKEARTFIAENYPAALRGKQDEGEELAKEAGKARDEGKEYIVHDGDVMLFRFNT